MTDLDPADWITNARSLAQSSSIPLGVPVNIHMDMLLRDTRRDLQAACDALEAVLKGHRPVSFSFSWRDGVTMHEVCDTCHDKAGVHPCGCWRDEDVSHLCAVCSDPEHRMEAPWPCMMVRDIAAALGVEP